MGGQSILINDLGSDNFKSAHEWDGNNPDSPNSPFPLTSSKDNTPRIFLQVPLSLIPSTSSFQTYVPHLKIFFRILNLNSTLTLREARTVYYLLARKYHPDKWNEEISKISKAESGERFKRISNAFEDLKVSIVWRNY